MINKKAYTNGKIYTVNPAQPWAEAVVTNEDKIVFVGSNEDSKKYIDEFTEVIDLNGRLMLPGFIDAHAHIVMGGFYLLSIDLTEVSSKEEFISSLSEYVKAKPGKWVTEGNWNHENWEGSPLPRKEWIDEFTQETPVFVVRMDYHMGLANSYALKLAGITKDTPDPAGGTIIRDPETGEPTGLLRDKAMDLVYSVIPTPTEDEHEKAIEAALDEARRFGVTSIHDITYKNHLKYLQRFEKDDRLTCRIYSRLMIDLHKDLIDAEIEHNFGSDKLKIGSMKAFADGSLGSNTGWFFEPYNDEPDTSGLAMEKMQDGRLKEWMLECDRNKLQLSIHAIGDRAVSELIDIAETMKNGNAPWDRRFRIEHAQHIRQEDIKRCADLDIIVSAQPYHLFYDGDYLEKKLGEKRVKDSYTFNSFIKSNVKLCFGSDWSVVSLNPMTGIYAAVKRNSLNGKNEAGIVPEEKISVEEAVKCYTINGAYAAYAEDKLGSLEPGKLADLVVLNENIFEIDLDQLINVSINLTVFNGEIVHSCDQK